MIFPAGNLRGTWSAPGGWRGIAILALISTGVLPAATSAPLSQRSHTSWTARNGFDAFPVRALSQTANGYLWIGTPKGLWRFDGDRFTRWQPRAGEDGLPSPDIRSLWAARDGGLWIGTAAGISKFAGGRLTNYAAPREWLPNSIRALLESDGLWAGSSNAGLKTLAHLTPWGEWNYSSLPRLADASVNAILEDRDRSLWIGTRSGLCRLSSGNATYFLTDPPTEIYAIAQDLDGRLFVACAAHPGILRLSAGRFVPAAGTDGDAAIRARALLCDRSNAVWAGTFSQGVVQIDGGQVDRYSTNNGLSGASIEAFLEDREGDIWVGTRTGLDRFRPARVVYQTAPQGLPEDIITSVSSGGRERTWVGTATSGLLRLEHDRFVRVATGNAGDSILSMYEDPAGQLWLGTMTGLLTYSDRRFKAVRTEGGEPLTRVTAITGRGLDRVWLSDARKGLYSVNHGIARPVPAAPPSNETEVYALMASDDGRLWIGYYGGDVAVVNSGELTLYRAADRSFKGAVLSLYQDARGIVWAGTSRGLTRFRNGRWTEWTSAEGVRGGLVQGVIADDWNGLWLNTEGGLLRIPMSELDGQPDGSPSPLHPLIYGISSGVPPQGGAMRSQPRIARSDDGRIWFAREDGIAIVDPHRAIPDPVRPQVIVEELRLDGSLLSSGPAGGKPLAFRGHQLEIDFTATSLAAAENTRFRYQLAGYDSTWVDVGSDRHARYLDLPPGHYRFTVAASNAEGMWQDAMGATEFTVLPYFYQTWYFRTLCVAVASTVLFTAYRRRIRQVRRIFELRAEERLVERTRIARELHDTLLQSVVGTSLQLDALANRDRLPLDAIQSELRRIRRQVDDSLREARHCVWSLRSPIWTGRDFVTALQEIVAGVMAGRQVQFSVIVEGRPYPYPHDTEEHLLRIVHQAITNSVQHSGCSTVCVRATYGGRDFCLQIVDDGAGLDTELLSAGRPGHFGLANMRERAEEIGAAFRIKSGLRLGTTVELRLLAPTRRGVLAAIGLKL